MIKSLSYYSFMLVFFSEAFVFKARTGSLKRDETS